MGSQFDGVLDGVEVLAPLARLTQVREAYFGECKARHDHHHPWNTGTFLRVLQKIGGIGCQLFFTARPEALAGRSIQLIDQRLLDGRMASSF